MVVMMVHFFATGKLEFEEKLGCFEQNDFCALYPLTHAVPDIIVCPVIHFITKLTMNFPTFSRLFRIHLKICGTSMMQKTCISGTVGCSKDVLRRSPSPDIPVRQDNSITHS